MQLLSWFLRFQRADPATAIVVQAAIAHEDLSVLLGGLLLFVVAADSRGLSHWEHTGKFELAQLALVTLDVFVADQTGPAFFDRQGIAVLFVGGFIQGLGYCFCLF